MAGVANLWMLSSVVTAAGQIDQIVSQDLDLGIEEIMEGSSGLPDTQFAAINEQKPVLSFTTTALAKALTICGLQAYAVAANCDFYFQKVLQGGVRAGATSHLRVRATRGMIIPRTIRAQQGDKTGAKLSYSFYAISTDGVAAPLTITAAQSLPTISPITEMFTVGPVSLTPAGGAATPLAAIQEINADMGFTEECVGSDGQAYPTFCGVITRRPNIGINGLDMTALSTFGLAGGGLDAFACYFKKIASGGTRVVDGTAQHIKLAGTAGMMRPKSTRGEDKRKMEGEWNISPVFDGTNDVVAISTASAIT